MGAVSMFAHKGLQRVIGELEETTNDDGGNYGAMSSVWAVMVLQCRGKDRKSLAVNWRVVNDYPKARLGDVIYFKVDVSYPLAHLIIVV